MPSIEARSSTHEARQPKTRSVSRAVKQESRETSHRYQSHYGGFITEDDIDVMLDDFAKEDEQWEKTWSRKFVEGVLQHRRWYFPKQEGPDAPSLEKAWAFYEHVSLPRRVVGEQATQYTFRRAEQGETEDTELYNPFRTPQAALIEWGIGVDLYFSTVRYLGIIFLIAGFINLNNLVFYGSDAYSDRSTSPFNVPPTLQGSMVCTNREWVVCPDCFRHNASFSTITSERIAYSGGTTLVQRNDCQGAQLEQGLANWFTLVFMIVIISLLSYYLSLREVRFDEDKVTSTDYSVVVRNPPKDAYDVEEWKDFFSQFAEKQVTAITVALNNQKLLRKLVSLRVKRDKLRKMLPEGVNMEDEDIVRNAVAALTREQESEPKGCCGWICGCTLMPLLRMIGIIQTPEALVDKIYDLVDKIQDLQKREYRVTEVFVTFETEEGQRAALTALSVSQMAIITNFKFAVDPKHLFRDKVLDVREPAEPSAVRWLDLSTSRTTMNLLTTFNFFVTIGILAAAGALVDFVRRGWGPWWSSKVTTIMNVSIPLFVNKILMKYERHRSEGDYQTSLYIKITLFRWVNTTILAKVITPFISTLGWTTQDMLASVDSILRSELWLVPILRLCDISSNLKKHVFGPRAKTQEEMNLNFQGTTYNMGERYTDLTKVLFLCCFYSSLHPLTFFYGAAIMTVQYYVDKFCLMRIWSFAPAIGPELAIFSRRYFFSGALMAFAVVSAYTYAQFPFDNVCFPDKPDTGVAGFYPNVTFANGTVINVTVTRNETVSFCSQQWFDIPEGQRFPVLPRIQPSNMRWMTDSQEMVVRLYGWTALVILVIYLCTVFGGTVTLMFVSLYKGTYEPDGLSQKIDFSNVQDIFGYVPQVQRKDFPFPFLACNVDEMKKSLIGWTDPVHDFDHHNLIFDVPYPGMHRQRVTTTKEENENGQSGKPAVSAEGDKNSNASAEVAKRPIFAVVKHYPPPWQLEDTTAKA